MSKKKKYSIDYFLSQESFIDWIRGEKGLDKYWQEWISHHPEAKDDFYSAKFIASEIEIKEDKVSPQWIENIKKGIDTSITNDPQFIGDSELSHHKNSKNPKWIYYAASIALILCFSFFMSFYGKNLFNTDHSAHYTRSAQEGQKLTFYLKDGTKVKLNSASSIEYGEFTDSSRVIYLDGEAFFDVVRDTLRPFTVVTNNVNTRVLGTSFNVNARKEDGSVTVALVSGSVELSKGNNKVKLHPGQVARSDKNADIRFIDEDISRFIGWKEGIIIFDYATMNEVLNELSNWYGVTFEVSGVDSKKADWEYTGSFDNQNLHVVLSSLSFVKQFKYEIKNDTIYINY